MIINHNLPAMFATRTLGETAGGMQKNIESLSSGYRINRAGDDASGLAVSEKMRSQIRGLRQAERNANDGIAFIQTAEGALQETHSILHRVRELAIQAANGIYTDADRMQIQVEVSQLSKEITRIAEQTEYNKLTILDGKRFSQPAGGINFQVGANVDQQINAFIGTMTAQSLGVEGVSLSNVQKANQTIQMVDTAVARVSQQRANLGAWQNRLEHTVRDLATTAENTQAAESRIRDADIARSMVDFVKNQILLQTGTAVSVQANLTPKTVLQLLA